jgi:hypothetical protein
MTETVSPGDVPSPDTPDPAPDHDDADDAAQEPGEIVPEGDEQPETFSREYVEGLRSENASLRVRAKRADELHTRLLDAVVREGTAGVLEDPDDVWRDREVDAFLDDAGLPSVERVREVAQELAKSKPHLARRRPTGHIDQGAKTEQLEAVSLAARLREAAG